MKQRTTFLHVQSDTREYALLPDLDAAGEVSSTKIIPSSHPVMHPPSVLRFWFRRVYQARIQMERKNIACEVDRLLHIYSTLKGWLLFFQPSKRKISYFATYCSTFTHARYHFWWPITLLPLEISAGLVFSLWNREVDPALGQLGHSCQFLFIISGTQLDVWNSQTLGETHVCLNFRNRLLAGNEYLVTVAQLCLSKSKSNPRGCQKQKRNQTASCLSVQNLVSAWKFCFSCKIICSLNIL